ncbi:unnamed protein product [Rhizophagus irregularis]|nr:unnamed protein product [Rhizophagus irregularis]
MYQNLAVSYGINADDILKNPTKTKLNVTKRIKPIRVWTCSNGKKHSLDNRRLYAFKEAIKLGAAIDTVTVEDANKRKNLLKELKWKMKHYPSKDWSTIEIKENCNKK